MLRVVVDANVFISAVINPRGAPGRLVDSARSGQYVLVVSPLLLAEVEEVLGRDRVRRRLPPGAAERFLTELRALAELAPDARHPLPPVTRDPDDDYLVALAREAAVDCLVTGDADLTSLVELSPPVWSPAAFLARLDAGPRESG
ncbi:MAG: putative toxin-antitoxin system toxin component, PIN family [Candidatus Dormibacteraeota bacterium]|nr:putative toxin-antitoxin system toxin component, PIN family [Candidatus Dormibacteraeota bacterium]